MFIATPSEGMILPKQWWLLPKGLKLPRWLCQCVMRQRVSQSLRNYYGLKLKKTAKPARIDPWWPRLRPRGSSQTYLRYLAVTHPGWHRSSSQHQFAAVRRLHPLLSIEERACNEGRFNEPTGMHQALYRTFLKWDERSFTIRFRHFPRGLWPTHPWVPIHTMPPFLMRPSHGNGTLATSMGMWPLQIKQILAPNFWHATFTPTICIMSGPQRPKFLDLSQEFWNP